MSLPLPAGSAKGPAQPQLRGVLIYTNATECRGCDWVGVPNHPSKEKTFVLRPLTTPTPEFARAPHQIYCPLAQFFHPPPKRELAFPIP